MTTILLGMVLVSAEILTRGTGAKVSTSFLVSYCLMKDIKNEIDKRIYRAKCVKAVAMIFQGLGKDLLQITFDNCKIL